MLRPIALSVIMVALCTPSICAQQWARKMFDKCGTERSYDFGVVAKDSKAVHDFEFQNIFEEDIHVSSVRTSCGCTTPSVTKRTLKTWEKSAVRAVFNTGSFTGSRSATLTLTIDKPYRAEVQLSVRGYIRRDVMFSPGSVAFGDIEFGEAAERKVRVTYYGRSSWKIAEVRSPYKYVDVQLGDRQGSYGSYSYLLTVRLADNAPPGYLQDQLAIVTNDSYNRSLELPIEGRVISPLTVSPASLFLGVVHPGDVVDKKQLFVRGTKPFRITGIECPGDSFKFQIPEATKQAHLVRFTFTAGADPGTVTRQIKIKTDLGVTASCVASARITVPEVDAADPKADSGDSR